MNEVLSRVYTGTYYLQEIDIFLNYNSKSFHLSCLLGLYMLPNQPLSLRNENITILNNVTNWLDFCVTTFSSSKVVIDLIKVSLIILL